MSMINVKKEEENNNKEKPKKTYTALKLGNRSYLRIIWLS